MKRDIAQVEEACRFQYVAVHISDATRACTTNNTNGIKNLPTVLQDIKLMNDIFDKSPYSMKGKAIRGQLGAIETEVVPLPKSILEYDKIMTLFVDVIFVNKVDYLITVQYLFWISAWIDINGDSCDERYYPEYCEIIYC